MPEQDKESPIRHDEEPLMVSTENLEKTFQVGNSKITVLSGISIKIPKATFAVISGPSGSGKTTLLNIISGIDRPTKGKLVIGDQDLTDKDENFLSEYRLSHIGFVFQAYNLVSTLTVVENVAFPMEWMRKPQDMIEKRVNELITTVGLEHPRKPLSPAVKRWRTATGRVCKGVS